MTSRTFGAATRRVLFGAASAAAMLAGASFAQAQVSTTGAEADLTVGVVPNDLVDPASPPWPNHPAYSPQVLDNATDITGVGQQYRTDGFVCSGTLINPRTVISASHCYYTRPANAFGIGGVEVAYGFKFDNLPGLRNFLFGAVGPNGARTGPLYQSRVADALYRVNQVWYHSGPVPPTGEFANGDIALITLDTHVENVPTWTMLFSPLEGPTHVTIAGYGGTGSGTLGNNLGIDYRRRTAENMIDALMTYRDFTAAPAIEGPDSTRNTQYQHAIYWMDFDDPNWDPNNLPENFFNNTAGPGKRSNGYYDFNGLGGPDGTALDREGTTAGGDSGGPLIVDQRWDKKVVAGVLTGSVSYNGGIATYGSFSVYPPLFQFWQDIVANNPYVYASAKAGNGDWFDATHWVQDMDPNYAIIGPDGELVNSLPSYAQGGADGPVQKFGTLCFVNEFCSDITGGGGNPVDTGVALVMAGGPGSTNFVPNNIEPVRSNDPALFRKARYYDVTLREHGITTMGGAATIDKLTLDGPAKLDVTGAGDLKVLSDFTQIAGWTNVDGKLTTGEAVAMTGLLSGSGTFKAPYLTVGAVSVAPGGADRYGTLTIDGNLVLTSGASLFIDASRDGADKLAVTGQAALGGSLVFNKPTDAPAPRHGDTHVIVSAAGGLATNADGEVYKFDNTIFSFQGVLRPELTYSANSVSALLRAGSFVEMLEGATPTQLAFAQTLDTLRNGSYGDLYNLYGGIDLMGAGALAATFDNLAPTGVNGSLSLYDMQSSNMSDMFNARLSMLGRGDAPEGLSIGAGLGQVLAFGSDDLTGGASGVGAKGGFGLTSDSSTVQVANLPKGMSAFVTGGYSEDRASATAGRAALTAEEGGKGWHMAAGVENRMTERFTLGVATAYAKGESAYGGVASMAQNELMQSAVYGAYRMNHGVYVAGLAGAGLNKSDTRRRFGAGLTPYDLQGELEGQSFNAAVETGVNVDLGRGLTLTPKAGMRWSQLATDGFSERGGDAALAVDGRTVERAESRIGLALAGTMQTRSGWTITPQVETSLVQNLSGDDAGVVVRFAGADSQSFYLPGLERDSNWAEVKGGLRLQRDALGFGLDVSSSVLREELHEDRVAASVSLKF